MKYFMITKKDLSLIIIMIIWIISIVGVITASLYTTASAAVKKYPVYSVEAECKKVALTFNCAWDDKGLGELLEILEEYDVSATFFFVGDFAEKYPEAVRRIHNRGFEVGNHSMKHKDPVKQDFSELVDDISSCNELIYSITGVTPRLYRAPSGSYDNKTIEAAQSLGMTSIQWDVDSIDWKNPSSDKIISRVTDKVRNGSIVLFHLGKENTLDALPSVIKILKKEGYYFSSVGDMLLDGETFIDNAGRQHQKIIYG